MRNSIRMVVGNQRHAEKCSFVREVIARRTSLCADCDARLALLGRPELLADDLTASRGWRTNRDPRAEVVVAAALVICGFAVVRNAMADCGRTCPSPERLLAWQAGVRREAGEPMRALAGAAPPSTLLVV